MARSVGETLSAWGDDDEGAVVEIRSESETHSGVYVYSVRNTECAYVSGRSFQGDVNLDSWEVRIESPAEKR